MARRGSLAPFALAAALLGARAVAAELPVARLDTVFPPGGQAGTEIEVAITGADLDEAKALHFSASGITAEPKDKQFLVKIASDVPPGIYDVRVSGLLGISNPRAFEVGDLAQTTKPSGNSTPGAAIDLLLDSTIAGTSTAGQADWFEFSAKQGQRLLVECEAAEIDSRMRPVLTVLDRKGAELGTSRRGGLLDFTAPAEGRYLLELHDLTFAGSADHFYRLTLTTGPHLDVIFPPCGQPGTKGRFALFGRNLPGGEKANLIGLDGKPLEKLEVEIDLPAAGDPHADGWTDPAAAALDGFSFRLKTPHASNAIVIGLTNGPIVTQQEPHDRPARAQKLTPPCEVAGRFFPAGEMDAYRFEAKKGEVWWIEVVSARLGLPTSPFFVVQHDAADLLEAYAAETSAGGPRFSTASNDPAARFEAKEDETCRLELLDLFGGSRNDPRNVYRLVIRKEAPDFRLAAVAEPPPENKDDHKAAPRATLLRADDTAAIRIVALRRDGFAGEIDVSAEGLPPGVRSLPARIAAGANEALLLVTSCEKPEPWAGPIRIVGKAKIGEAEIVHEARGGAVRWSVADPNVEAILPRLTRDFALGVSAAESAPVSVVAAEEKSWEIVAGGRIEIPLKITRRGEFKEALELKAAGAPGLEAVKAISVAANSGTASATIDLATAKLPVGEQVIYFTAQAKGKFRGKDVVTTIYSAPIRIVVDAAQAP